MLRNQIVRIGSGCNWRRFTLFTLLFRPVVGLLANTLRTARANVDDCVMFNWRVVAYLNVISEHVTGDETHEKPHSR
jgi:hypothetical protein